MANYQLALELTLKNEGGWVFDDADTGKETYCGISRANFPMWSGWPLVDKHKPLHTGQLISDPQLDKSISDFYRSNFWAPICGDEIINQQVANDLFDSATNTGVRQAIILCQRALGIPETGHMDSSTLNILNQINPYA